MSKLIPAEKDKAAAIKALLHLADEMLKPILSERQRQKLMASASARNLESKRHLLSTLSLCQENEVFDRSSFFAPYVCKQLIGSITEYRRASPDIYEAGKERIHKLHDEAVDMLSGDIKDALEINQGILSMPAERNRGNLIWLMKDIWHGQRRSGPKDTLSTTEILDIFTKQRNRGIVEDYMKQWPAPCLDPSCNRKSSFIQWVTAWKRLNRLVDVMDEVPFMRCVAAWKSFVHEQAETITCPTYADLQEREDRVTAAATRGDVLEYDEFKSYKDSEKKLQQLYETIMKRLLMLRGLDPFSNAPSRPRDFQDPLDTLRRNFKKKQKNLSAGMRYLIFEPKKDISQVNDAKVLRDLVDTFMSFKGPRHPNLPSARTLRSLPKLNAVSQHIIKVLKLPEAEEQHHVSANEAACGDEMCTLPTWEKNKTTAICNAKDLKDYARRTHPDKQAHGPAAHASKERKAEVAKALEFALSCKNSNFYCLDPTLCHDVRAAFHVQPAPTTLQALMEYWITDSKALQTLSLELSWSEEQKNRIKSHWHVLLGALHRTSRHINAEEKLAEEQDLATFSALREAWRNALESQAESPMKDALQGLINVSLEASLYAEERVKKARAKFVVQRPNALDDDLKDEIKLSPEEQIINAADDVVLSLNEQTFTAWAGSLTEARTGALELSEKRRAWERASEQQNARLDKSREHAKRAAIEKEFRDQPPPPGQEAHWRFN